MCQGHRPARTRVPVDRRRAHASAEAWARDTPAWAAASAEAVDVFARVNARVWEEVAATDPHPWKQVSTGIATSLEDTPKPRMRRSAGQGAGPGVRRNRQVRADAGRRLQQRR
ncbi:hypothetical protein GCM10009545_43500 [Saccharopolyspora thermophila]|uniref:Uncharacterized protein n=1 Tax=Saccharopolyspora thermophila TaxID=89367 RepID=A0ABP3N928_9PSEU